MGRPIRLDIPGVVKCHNCQRTHAYAVKGQFMQDMYDVWAGMNSGHIDHIMGPFAAQYNTYAPDPFLCGQNEGKSDINCRNEGVRFWSNVKIKTKEPRTQRRHRHVRMKDAQKQKADLLATLAAVGDAESIERSKRSLVTAH